MSAQNDRETLFARLAETGRAGELPPAWRSRRRFDDLAARFSRSLQAVHGRVFEAGSLSAAHAVLAERLGALGVGEVVITGEALLGEFRPPPGSIRQLHRQSDYEGRPAAWRALCARAGAGVTGVEALLAETGTLVVRSGPGKSRLVSLLPPVHVALAPFSSLTADLFTWLAERPEDERWPANRVLISGPSKTADIEQTMSVGVHGPRELIVILYRE